MLLAKTVLSCARFYSQGLKLAMPSSYPVGRQRPLKSSHAVKDDPRARPGMTKAEIIDRQK
jgi:hypothetical protein